MCTNNGNISIDSNAIMKFPGIDDYPIRWLDCYHLDPTSISKNVAQSPISWHAIGHQVVLDGLEPDNRVLVHSMDGKLVESINASSTKLELAMLNAQAIYTVSVIGTKQGYSFLVAIP